MATTSTDCPNPKCLGIGTFRKGYCYRCGFHPQTTSAPAHGQTTDRPPATVLATTSAPKSPSTSKSTGDSTQNLRRGASLIIAYLISASYGVRLEGKVASPVAIRTSVVALGHGDRLTKLAMLLAGSYAVLLLVRTYLPFIVVFLVLLLFIPRLRSFIPISWLLHLSGTRPYTPRQEVEIPVNTFTMATSDGRLLEVVLRGELRGGGVRQGDTISILGRILRNTTIQTRSMTSLTTGASTTTRDHPALVKSRSKSIVSLIAIATLCFLIYAQIRAYTT